MPDQFQALAMQSNLAVAILANPDVSDIEMVRVTPRALSDSELDALTVQWSGRGLAFIGIAGLVNGTVRTALDVPLDIGRTNALAAAFVEYCRVLLADKSQPQSPAELEPEYDWHAQQYRLVPRGN